MSFFSALFKKPAWLLTPDAFRQKMKEAGKNKKLVDVRTPAEFSSDAIKGAVNVNIQSEDFLKRVRKLPKDKTYLVYCRSGHRSKAAVKMMMAEGLTAFSLSGGLMNYK